MANPIWSDDYLNELNEESIEDINTDVPSLYHRFYLATTADLSVYTLPTKCKAILRITWRGKKIEPLSWEEMTILAAKAAFVDQTHSVEMTSSRPQWYSLHPTNIRDIKFYPTPNESFLDTGGDPYSPGVNEARCTISCWRFVDITDASAVPPAYIDRRTRKAHILWHAFMKEGKGQDLRAAAFYEQKYKFLISQFKALNEGIFVSKRYGLDDGTTIDRRGRIPRPTLPSNYERVDY